MTVAQTAEGHTVLRSGNVDRRADVVGETTVLVKVDDDQSVDSSQQRIISRIRCKYSRFIPVLGLSDSIIQMLDELLTSCHIRGRVHRVDGAALGVDVTECRQGASLEIRVELICVHELVHGIVLDPLVHPGINDISLVVVLPGDVLLRKRLEDGLGTSGSGHIGRPSKSLLGVVYHSTG